MQKYYSNLDDYTDTRPIKADGVYKANHAGSDLRRCNGFDVFCSRCVGSVVRGGVTVSKIIIKMEKGVGGYECPECGNDDIELGQNYCEDCGEPIEWEEKYD